MNIVHVLKVSILVACRCLDRIVIEYTTGDIEHAGGGPHSIEIIVAGENRTVPNVLHANDGE